MLAWAVESPGPIDGVEFLKVAADIPIRVTTVSYALAEADSALRDVAADRFAGAAVLSTGSRS